MQAQEIKIITPPTIEMYITLNVHNKNSGKGIVSEELK